MAGVQRAHRRDEPNDVATRARGAQHGPELGDGSDNPHRVSSPSEAVTGIRIRAGSHVVAECPHRAAHLAAIAAYRLRNFGGEGVVEAQQVVQDEHLPGAVRTRADPDRRDGDGGQ